MNKIYTMEEKIMLGLGFEEMSSSNLYLRGGTTDFWTNLFTRIKAMVNFIADYVPKFIKGVCEGFGVTIFKKLAV